jgi:hypothetical protein
MVKKGRIVDAEYPLCPKLYKKGQHINYCWNVWKGSALRVGIYVALKYWRLRSSQNLQQQLTI